MKYAALLRGVNVGGTGKISMKELAEVFASAGMLHVRTYINSGNVIFETAKKDRAEITRTLEDAIEQHFGFGVRVLIKDHGEIRSIVAALPKDWANDAAHKCDVFFLWPEADDPSVLETLDYDSTVDDVCYTPGAVARHTAREVVAKSRLTRLAGTPLYKNITVRNCNTTRKLLALLEE
jgi:uncharacterized protein (DUF1697 family)